MAIFQRHLAFVSSAPSTNTRSVSDLIYDRHTQQSRVFSPAKHVGSKCIKIPPSGYNGTKLNFQKAERHAQITRLDGGRGHRGFSTGAKEQKSEEGKEEEKVGGGKQAEV